MRSSRKSLVLGSALLCASIAFGQGKGLHDEKKAELRATAAASTVYGNYSCPNMSFSVNKNGTLLYSDVSTSIMGGAQVLPLTKIVANSFKAVKTVPGGSFSIEGTLDGVKLKVTILRKSVYGGTNQGTEQCTKHGVITTEKKEGPICKDKLRRGVFIRPCVGGLFTNATFKKTKAGSIEDFCEDLKLSSITDLFIAFKSDGHPVCEESGTLLFSNTFDSTTNDKKDRLQQSRLNGYDPIKEIVNVCASKRIKIHAWFPVFHDKVAIEMFGGPEKAGQKASFPEIPTVSPAARVVAKEYDFYSAEAADPGNQEIVNYELARLEELLRMYPKLAGVNLDYIRYSSEKTPKRETNDVDGRVWLTNPSKINEFIETVKQRLRAIKPSIIISADVFADAQMRLITGQADVPSKVDITLPMTYLHYSGFGGPDSIRQSFQEFEDAPTLVFPLVRGWNQDPEISRRSRGIKQDVIDSVQTIKDLNAKGIVIFTYEQFLAAMGKSSLRDAITEVPNYCE